MLKVPNSIPVKTRLPLSAWAVAALVSFFCVVSSLLHLSPVDHQANARVEQMNMHGDQARILLQAYDGCCYELDRHYPVTGVGQPVQNRWAVMNRAPRGNQT